MRYLIKATGYKGQGRDFDDIEIPVEIEVYGGRENTSIVLDLGQGKQWWIPIWEVDHLLEILDILLAEEEYGIH